MKRLFCFALLLSANLVPCNAAPKPTGAIIVRLDDIQGLWGGQTLVVDASGNLFARKVDKQRKEQRYHIQLSSEDLKTLLAFVGKSGLEEYRENKRPGVPDEARPTITLSLPNQPKVTAAKWANEKDPKFDKLYKKLLQMIERAAKSSPYLSGDHDDQAVYP